MKPWNASITPRLETQATWMARPSVGLLYVWATPLLACVAALPDLRLGGLQFGGWMWASLLVIGIWLLVVELVFHRESQIRFPCGPWAAWLGYLWISLVWCDTFGLRSLQDAVQISMPVLMAVVGSVFVRRPAELRTLLRAFAVTLVPLGMITILPHLVPAFASEDSLSNRSAGLLAALAAAASLAAYPPHMLAAFAGWGACLTLIAITQSRMAGLATLLIPALHPWRIGPWRRTAAMAVPLACMLAVFASPVFQQRSFHRGEGDLEDVLQGDINTSGRFEVWPLILTEAWRRPVLGHGIGSASAFVPSVWPNIGHPHNDYLRVGFDLGLVGLGLFVGVNVWQLWDLKRKMAVAEATVRRALIASFLGLAVLLIVAATDNALVYNLLFTDPLFALMGAAYGTFHESQQRAV